MILWRHYEGLSNKTHDDGWRGVKNCPNLRDVIYGRPLNVRIKQTKVNNQLNLCSYFWWHIRAECVIFKCSHNLLDFNCDFVTYARSRHLEVLKNEKRICLNWKWQRTKKVRPWHGVVPLNSHLSSSSSQMRIWNTFWSTFPI